MSLHKQKRLVSQIRQNPLQAIREVWIDTDLDYTMNELKYWLYMALSHENTVYEDADERKQLIEFYDKFIMLVNATFYFGKVEKSGRRSDPVILFKAFTNLYPIDYVKAELWDFLKAVGNYEGPFTENIDKPNIFELYSNLLCLAEAAYLVSAGTEGASTL